MAPFRGGIVRNYHLFHIILFIFITGCATTPSDPYMDSRKSSTWNAFTHRNSQINDFRLLGRMSLVAEGENHQASFDWSHYPSGYELTLTGPLQVGHLKIINDDASISLQTDQDTIFISDTAEHLMEEVLGWSAPVSALAYWVRAIPVPNAPFEASVDASGHPHLIRQYGWSIVYDRFQKDLPTRLAMESKGIRLKIIVQKWDL